jgi:hypothetical protein
MDLGLYFVFKERLDLEPGEIEILLGVINAPWVFKMVFGIMADNYTFLGSRRKSYLFAATTLNLLSLFLLMSFGLLYGKFFIVACVFMTQLCMTFCDAVSDALVV